MVLIESKRKKYKNIFTHIYIIYTECSFWVKEILADMSEIAISTIKKIESGKGNPSLSTVEKIMDILGMEVKYEIRQTV